MAVMSVIYLKQYNNVVCYLHNKLYRHRGEYHQSDSERNKETARPTDHLESEEKHENAVRAAARKGQREDIGKVSWSLRVQSTGCQQ